jgi:protocatechuate 3,4-dioxygenase, alpha subunit
MARVLTGSQTVGPFFHPLLNPRWSDLVQPETRGQRIRLEGRVLDGDGAPLAKDAMLEIWQANAEGRYDHPEDRQERLVDPTFHGFGRSGTDADGRFHFRTVKPGSVPGSGEKLQAPHINLVVFARGVLTHLYTRVYFPGEPLNAKDPWLNAVPAARRQTLIARDAGVVNGEQVYSFNVILQGDGETVFFDV